MHLSCVQSAVPTTEIGELFRLDGQTAIVTGASSGIGRELARALSAAGANVVLAARRDEPLRALAAELRDAMAIPTDLLDEEARLQLVNAAMSRYGRIDILVNNAGVIETAPAELEQADSFRRVIEVNLVSTFLLTQLVAEHMFEAGQGSIINIASIFGLVGSGQIPAASYAASKGGLVNLTRELAAQWSGRGIRVNAIAPGWFASEMTADMLASEAGRRWVERRTPVNRTGLSHELDGAVVFLASHASSYVTGHVLVVDGGWTTI